MTESHNPKNFARSLIKLNGLMCADLEGVSYWYDAFTQSQRVDFVVRKVEGERLPPKDARLSNFDTFCDDAADKWCWEHVEKGTCVRFKMFGTIGKTHDKQELEAIHRSAAGEHHRNRKRQK